MKRRGFTLIELVMVLVIVGILAVIAIPRYLDLSSSAKLNASKAAISSIRAAIAVKYAENVTAGAANYPAAIDGTLFADGVVPMNHLDPPGNAVVAVYDGSGGWVYNAANGTVRSNDTAGTGM